jgi:hypothetical protein
VVVYIKKVIRIKPKSTIGVKSTRGKGLLRLPEWEESVTSAITSVYGKTETGANYIMDRQ